MAIDFTGKDPWSSIGGGLVGGEVNPALSMIGGDWLSTGLQVAGVLFGGGKTDISGAGAGGSGSLNTSGWAVGDSSAEGADLTSSQTMQSMNNWPWWYWAAGSLVVIAIIKKAV
jgi:hypothetical protein